MTPAPMVVETPTNFSESTRCNSQVNNVFYCRFNRRGNLKTILGYANEVGESFRTLVPKSVVHASYVVAFGYILADTGDKTIKVHEKEKKKLTYSLSHVLITAADTAVWQTLASVAIPGFTINRLCALTFYTLTKFTKLPLNSRKWTTTAVGLGSIPFIVKPIDRLVDHIMEKIFRPFYSED